MKRFRIAFSFAGEKREFVKRVADILAGQFGETAILYDQFHEAEFAVYDLGIRLSKLYGEQSDLIVPVLCPAYDVKRWTGWEWVHIYGLLTKTDGHRVMPSRFEHAQADGLAPTAGFIELDHKAPEEFASLILQRLAINEGNPKEHYLKPSAPLARVPKTSIPHNLPTLQPFFGREEELKRIADALDSESRTWGALIDGPGGMGKTSLAVRAAYDASPDAFKKIIFLSLKTRELDDDGVRDLSGFILPGLVELLNELARELGQDDVVKAPENQRPRLLRDALPGTHTLLVLDNLESLIKPERDILFTFVKRLPADCKAILTSRGRIGSGAEELILEKLSAEAALATLAELATHNPRLAETSEAERLALYRETAGNPLLLRWTAGQLGRGHCLTFTDALHFIRSCPEGNDPLEFIFGDLVEHFSETETKVLCALTYFTLPAKIEHVAIIAGLLESDANQALRSLANRSLAVPTDELKAFTLVPMVADFLRKKKPAVVAETGDRLKKRAYVCIMENGFRKYDRFNILEAAWPSIAPALPIFLAGDNGRLPIVCEALKTFLSFEGRWDELLAFTHAAEACAVAANDFDGAGILASDLAYHHVLRRDAESVRACTDRAAAHWGQTRDHVRKRALVAGLRGEYHKLKDDHPASIDSLLEAVELWRSIPAESRQVASILNSIADAKFLAGDIHSAKGYFHQALHMSQGIDCDDCIDIQAIAMSNLAFIALLQQEWLNAEKLAREALPLAENVGRHQLIASICYRLAFALIRQERHAEALPHARRAAEIRSRLGLLSEVAHAQAIIDECESKV